MRRLTIPLVAFAALAALAVSERPASADGPAPDPLAKARELEQQGQALLDAGRCAEGARHMAEAWRIRAAVWGGGVADDQAAQMRALMEKQAQEMERAMRERPAAPPSPSPEARQKLEALHQALHAEELAIEEARKAGAETAEAEHVEKAKALRREIKAVKAALAGHDGEAPPAGGDDADLPKHLMRARIEMREAQVAAETAAAAGNRAAAAEQTARAARLRARVEELEGRARARAAGDASRPAREAGGRGEGLAGDVARLRAEVADLRRLIEELKERLAPSGR